MGGGIINVVEGVNAILCRELRSKLGQELKFTVRFSGFQTKIRNPDIRNTKIPTRMQRSVELIRPFIFFLFQHKNNLVRI
jgi:hypothetical protein